MSNTQIENPSWLPPYSTRVSLKAKHLQVTISPYNGLEVVIPKRMKAVNIENFLLSKRAWIMRHAETIKKQQIEAISLPTELYLEAASERWKIFYESTERKEKIILRPQQEMVVMADKNDFIACQNLLKKWIKKHAKQFLLPYLEELSVETNLGYAGGSVRSQTTCWGSCTPKKNIQLNMQLLFVPQPVMRYVLIHELCHTVHLNHSKRFWKLVERYDPHYNAHRALLRKVQKTLPAWINYKSKAPDKLDET